MHLVREQHRGQGRARRLRLGVHRGPRVARDARARGVGAGAARRPAAAAAVRDVHVAGRVAAEGTTVDFIDETLPPDQSVTWVFDVVDGSAEEALDHANRLNIHPRVELSRVSD